MNLTGSNESAVLDLLRSRKADGRSDDDHRKLALIVEGGGMRGVLSAGSLLALDVLGYRECFDEVYATSAGAVNAAYFLSEQGALGITVYFDSISNRRFYNPFRLTKIVDVDYVYDYVVPVEKPLNERRIKEGRIELMFSLTDVVSGENVLASVNRSSESVAHLLKASSALPVLYNRTVEVEGRSYVDGGITCTVPIVQAVDRGCTDILVLLTRQHGYRIPMPTLLNRAALYVAMGRRYPALMRAYSDLPQTANRDREIVTGVRTLAGINIATICPTEAELVVGRTTIERLELVRGAHLMASKTSEIVGGDTSELEALFDGYYRSAAT